jgi:hypothetical protein
VVALLETALVQLRAPIVEVSFLKKLGHWLIGVGKRAGENAVEDAVSHIASSAGEDLLQIAAEILP